MTEQPKTLALDASEWKALLLTNMIRAHQAVTDAQNISPEGVQLLNGHLDRMKGLVAAWHASQVPLPLARNNDPAPAQANEAEPSKKRGGWPKGRKRNAPAQAVQ